MGGDGEVCRVPHLRARFVKVVIATTATIQVAARHGRGIVIS